MQIRFIKLDDRRHALEVVRGGRRERIETETRSTLFHDFTHLAVEEAARAGAGFFVALAGGRTLAELARPGKEGAYADEAAMQVERVVAVLQRLAKVDEDPAALHARLTAALALQGETPPPWFTPGLVAAVRARLRELVGRWRATPYGAALEVGWREPGPQR